MGCGEASGAERDGRAVRIDDQSTQSSSEHMWWVPVEDMKMSAAPSDPSDPNGMDLGMDLGGDPGGVSVALDPKVFWVHKNSKQKAETFIGIPVGAPAESE